MYESIHFFPPKLLSIAFPYLYTGLTQTLNRLHLNLYSMNFPSIILYTILWQPLQDTYIAREPRTFLGRAENIRPSSLPTKVPIGTINFQGHLQTLRSTVPPCKGGPASIYT